MKILFEDDELIVVHKPAGLTIYSEAGAGDDLQSRLKSKVRGALFPVHRLDRGTCGLVVFGRTQMTAQKLQRLFLRRQVRKIYWAVVGGEFLQPQTVSAALKSKDGEIQNAQTTFTPLLEPWQDGEFTATLVRAEPKTGRFHQIRRHLREAGHPILGDDTYGKKPWNEFAAKRWGTARPLLSAVELTFPHPRNNRPVHVRTLPDADFRRVTDSWNLFK